MDALDGVIELFVSVGLLRRQLSREVRIHGIVSEGGDAPNVIPERAAARFWVRALDDDELEDEYDDELKAADASDDEG